jgi:hypothetical protein
MPASRRFATIVAVCIAACIASPASAASDGSVRNVVALPLDASDDFILDGLLDEPFWENAVPATGFLQQNPVEGSGASQRTDVRVAFDGAALYIGAMLHDDEPERILAYNRRRNAFPFTDDRFIVVLDPFGDGRNGYYFEVNPAGMMTDGLVSTGQGGGLDRSWDGIWDARVARTPEGWSVEMRIPFRTMNFNEDAPNWGINFQRTIRRNHEDVLWAAHRRNQGIYQLQNAGRLHGLSGMTQGFGLEVKPYVSASSRTGTVYDQSTTADVGFDVSYNLTPNLRTSVTVNTDFAEVEVDDRQVNLSRFPLRFPERRDFFLEGSNVFRFAPASDVEPYFSRRIGLAAGLPVPLHVGARLTGRVGRTDVGLLQVRTGGALLPGQRHVRSEDFTVARARHRILQESTFGLIYTRRASHASDFDHSDHTLGADLELGTSRFLGDRNLQFQAFLVWHNDPYIIDTTNVLSRPWHENTARGLRLAYPNDPWYGHVSYREFGLFFDPAVGFASRRGFKRLQPGIGYRPSFEQSDLIRNVNMNVTFTHLTDLDNTPESVAWSFQPFDILFETGDELRLQFYRGMERLPYDFDIRRDRSIIVPAGRYTGWGGSIRGLTTGRRPLSARVEYGREAFWSGVRDRYEFRLSLRTQVGLQLHGDYLINDVSLAEGDFSTHLMRLTGEIDPTPRISFTANLQYDNLSELLGFYGRMRWIARPGSNFYLVYSNNWMADDGRLFVTDRAVATKLSYTHWF